MYQFLDALKHAFGFCGEPHPNIFAIIAGVGATSFGCIVYYLKHFFNRK